MDTNELKKIIENHRHWLKEDYEGWENMKADLMYADLNHADLDDSERIRKGIVLNERMIGYKKCKNDIIVELEIPVGATVFSINNRKCRTNHCVVKSITDMYGNKIDRAYSIRKFFSYYVGDIIVRTDEHNGWFVHLIDTIDVRSYYKAYGSDLDYLLSEVIATIKQHKINWEQEQIGTEFWCRDKDSESWCKLQYAGLLYTGEPIFATDLRNTDTYSRFKQIKRVEGEL